MNVAALLEPASLAAGGPERNNKRLRGARDGDPPRTPGDAGMQAGSCGELRGSLQRREGPWHPSPRCSAPPGWQRGCCSAPWSRHRGPGCQSRQHRSSGGSQPCCPPNRLCHRGGEDASPPALAGQIPPSPLGLHGVPTPVPMLRVGHMALDGSETWLRPIKLMSRGSGPLHCPLGDWGQARAVLELRRPSQSSAGALLDLAGSSGGSQPFTAGALRHRHCAPQLLAAASPCPCHNKGKHLWMETAGGSSRQHCCRISPETQHSASKRHLGVCSPWQTPG